MATQIPPWLQIQPADYVRAGAEGAQAGLESSRLQQQGQEAGARIGLESQRLALEAQSESQRAQEQAARLSHEEQIAQMEMQARKDIAEKNAMRQSQQLAIENAMKSSQIGLQKQHIDQQMVLANQKAKEAAATYSDEQGFRQAIAGGVEPMEAAARFPRSRISTVSALGRMSRGSDASIVEHTEVPGFQFLRQPSGQEIPIQRPEKGMSEANKISIQKHIDALKREKKKLTDNPRVAAEIDAQIKEWNARIPGATGTGTTPPPSKGGKVFTDKSGKKWHYTGDASDPAKDKDLKHWELAE